MRTTLLSILTASALALAACGGSDEADSPADAADASESADATPSDDPDGDAAEADPAPVSDSNSESAPLPATVEVPADWDPLIPTDPIGGVGLTFIEVRPFDDTLSIYELQYDGVDQDGETLYAAYESLVLAAGWAPAAQSTPLVGSYSQADRTLAITAFGGPQSQIIVSVIPT